jgi:hypothetical protein
VKIHTAIAALIVASCLPAVAYADDQDDTNSQLPVADRTRPEYDPIGQRVGGFILYPQVDVQEMYDSNINASADGTHGDLITSINPSLNLKSDWNQNALNFHADSNSVEYARYGNNSYTDWSVGGDGKLDIYHDARAYGNLSYSVEHLPWWSPNTFIGQGKPTEYSDTAAGLTVEKEFDRLSFQLADNYDRYDFQNVTVNGTTALESRNDYGDERVNLHTGYELAPGRQVYLLTGFDWRAYDDTTDLFGYNRNSTGYVAAVGTKYDITGVTSMDLFVGYREQDYADTRLGSIDGPTGGATVTWNVTRLTTVTGTITRDIDETVISGAAGYFATAETVKVDHELLRNVILTGNISHETDDFQGIDRTDDYFKTGIGAKYLMNENFWLNGGYTYQTRDSNAVGTGAADNQVFLGVSARL